MASPITTNTRNLINEFTNRLTPSEPSLKKSVQILLDKAVIFGSAIYTYTSSIWYLNANENSIFMLIFNYGSTMKQKYYGKSNLISRFVFVVLFCKR